MKYFTYTNIGPRDINEDSFFATIKDGTLYACIADGVGGMDYGDIVSKFATKLFSEELIRFRNNQLQVSNDINERLTKYINDELTGANAASANSQKQTGTDIRSEDAGPAALSSGQGIGLTRPRHSACENATHVHRLFRKRGYRGGIRIRVRRDYRRGFGRRRAISVSAA